MMKVLECPFCGSKFNPGKTKSYKLIYSHYCSECSDYVLISLHRENKLELEEPFDLSSHNKKILVADDTALFHKLIGGILKEEGYEVFVADDGVSTLEIMNSIRPDLVILDLYMPGKNGIDVLMEARSSEDHRTRPILVISGKGGHPDEIKRLQKLGADGFLAKDAIKETLLFRVKNLLEG